MVTAGLHATAMGPKSNCSSDKQWYSLVKLDPFGLGHGSCDGELAELEEQLASVKQRMSQMEALAAK